MKLEDVVQSLLHMCLYSFCFSIVIKLHTNQIYESNENNWWMALEDGAPHNLAWA